MRIWDQIPPERLCRQHLLSEHRELHGIYNILVRLLEDPKAKIGYMNHPEVKRWKGHLPALAFRHMMLRLEMEKRLYNHNSDISMPTVHEIIWPIGLDNQAEILRKKGCECKV